MFRKVKGLIGRLLPSRLRGCIRTWRLKALVRGFSPRIVRHSYGGHELQIQLADPLSVGWYDKGWPVLNEIRFLRSHSLRPGATVFDIGAHQGVVALMLSREVAAHGKVVAIEASPHNAAAAEVNVRLNQAANLVVRCAAISDRPGRLTFNQGLNGQVDDGSGAWGRAEVLALTIDQLTEEYGPPDLLFIDIEGFECQALRGAAATLSRYHPDCFIEVHIGAGLERFGSINELLDHFPSELYKLYYLPDEKHFASPIPATPDELRSVDERFFLLAVSFV